MSVDWSSAGTDGSPRSPMGQCLGTCRGPGHRHSGWEVVGRQDQREMWEQIIPASGLLVSLAIEQVARR